MKCIKKELIQKYIDGEVSEKERLHIQEHLGTCTACRKKLEEQKHFTESLIKTLSSSVELNTSIPEFIFPATVKKKRSPKLKKYIYTTVAATACILLCFALITPKKTTEKEFVLLYSLENDFDANKPISQQEMTFYIIEPDGIIREYN